MGISVVVMGIKGRMGCTVAGMAQKDPDITLAGVVERPGNEKGLEGYGCVAGSDLSEVLPKTKGAVVIDFTAPEATVETAHAAARHGCPMVAGTTGLTQKQLGELESAARKTPLLWAPNMSVGINVLLKVLPDLVKNLGEKYDLEMVELHHNQKKDAPSGTAVKLAQCLANARGWDMGDVGKYCREGIIGARPKREIGVQAIRGGDVTGVHTVYFMGPGERIEVTHHAHSREMFAQGALLAAKWIVGRKPGRLYSMTDVLEGPCR